MSTGDERAVARRKKQHELDKLQLNEHVKNVLGTVAGRAVLWHILEMCNLHATSYNADQNVTFRLEGRRDIGLDLIALLEHVRPHAYVELMQQAKDREARRKEDLDNG